MLLGAFGSGRKEILARTPARDSCRPCRRTADRGTNDAGGAVGRSTVTRPPDHASADGDPDPVSVPWSIEKRRTRARVNRPAGALADWDDEGGFSRRASAEGRDRQASLAEEEEGTLRHLGAAVVARWNDLPTAVQRELFRHAVSVGEPSRTAELKERIARFLHAHKGAAGFSMSPAAGLHTGHRKS